MCEAARTGDVRPELVARVDEAVRDTRWDYVAPRMDRAFERAHSGVSRVTNIVAALKLFSHPRNELGPLDVNACLTTTLTVATPELKHVATVETALGDLPPVIGHAGDLNQVFLNLLVNAAHAIADANRDHGRIAVRTQRRGERVEIAIADTGCGIPPAIHARIFDPFFTTKEPGRGTGQGLALAHAVVVERHGGDIRFETGPAGTTFFIDLPIAGPHPARGVP
jgi:signal transduction histidine kinase